MVIVKWKDMFETEHILMQGRNDDIIYVTPDIRDEEGNSRTSIISLKAMKEFIEKLESA